MTIMEFIFEEFIHIIHKIITLVLKCTLIFFKTEELNMYNINTYNINQTPKLNSFFKNAFSLLYIQIRNKGKL